MMALS
jgi:hypothetical protein